MSDDNRFFRWLGHINAMLFFLVVAGAIVLLGGEALMWGNPMRDVPVTAEAKSGDDTYTFSGTFDGPFVAFGKPSVTRHGGFADAELDSQLRTNSSWPANAGHPGDVYSSYRRKRSERTWLQYAEPSWVARIRGP